MCRMDSGAIACRGEHSILDFSDKVAVSSIGDFLDLFPLLVGPELVPGVSHCLFIRPGEQVDELCPFSKPCLPRAEDVEPVGSHDPPGVVAEPVVKCFLVLVENLVDPKLMNHVSSFQPISHEERSLFCYDGDSSYLSGRHNK